jgi:hypothetical protein
MRALSVLVYCNCSIFPLFCHLFIYCFIVAFLDLMHMFTRESTFGFHTSFLSVGINLVWAYIELVTFSFELVVLLIIK